MNSADASPTGVLERVFRDIAATRMQGVPILNPALSVQPVGFQPWASGWLGVLVTPWFMNLMHLGGADPESGPLQPGEKRLLALPSGSYEFIAGEEPGIGRYQACSLFSPMSEFESQAQAVATAEAVMQNLMCPENRCEVSTHSREIAAAWNGDDTDRELTTADDEPLSERLETPLSRRAFLTGGDERE